ncbi:MAG TPA: LuxR C-terminal-related transcriptional regulator [Rhodocyclaceae bacterium]|jgi:PAS domain S-box-containing protein|nr:LuxR C-terminal-related transcriptional regulator [Rhodocyclaceae bacterium]
MPLIDFDAASHAGACTRSALMQLGDEPVAATQDLPDELILAFELAPVGLCVLRNRIVQRCNRGFAEMFGYTERELAGISLARLYPSQKEFEHIGRIGLPVMRATGCYSDDRIMLHRDGHLFWCHVAGRSLDRTDPFACSVWMFEDISTQRPVTTQLTPREREVVRELVTGKTSKQIARQLAISHRTVEAHRARLMRKLEVSTPGEMIARLAGMN